MFALPFDFAVSLEGVVAKSVVLTFESAILKLLAVCGLGHSFLLAESFQDSLRRAACVDADRTEVPLALFNFRDERAHLVIREGDQLVPT